MRLFVKVWRPFFREHSGNHVNGAKEPTPAGRLRNYRSMAEDGRLNVSEGDGARRATLGAEQKKFGRLECDDGTDEEQDDPMDSGSRNPWLRTEGWTYPQPRHDAHGYERYPENKHEQLGKQAAGYRYFWTAPKKQISHDFASNQQSPIGILRFHGSSVSIASRVVALGRRSNR